MHDELALAWAARPGLWRDSLRWTWFQPAFMAAVAAQDAAAPLQPDEDALTAAFLAWVRVVEACDAYARVDTNDHRQYLAGALLQQLLAAPRLLPQAAAGDPAWPQAPLLVGFVLTLLQAWRMQIGAPPLVVPPPSTQDWRALREHAADTPGSAIAWLDQVCGLEAVWDSPTLIGSRPAMLQARARG